MKITTILLVLSLAAYGCKAKEQKESHQSQQVQTADEQLAQEPKQDSLYYHIKRAADLKNEVLLILLHGYGSNEEDLMGLSEVFPENYTIVSPRATYMLQPGAYQWYQSNSVNGKYDGDTAQLKTSRDLIGHLVTKLQKNLSIEPERTFIAGFSQGANMSYQVGLMISGLCNGVGIFSGTLLESGKAGIIKNKNTGLGIFVGHGTKDNRISYDAASQSVNWLKERHFNTDFHAYQQMTHSISEREISDFVEFIQRRLR